MATKKAAVKQTGKKRGPAHGEAGPGRPKGSKNKKADVLETLRAAGIDPANVLAAEMELARAAGEHETVVQIASTLMPYCYPRLKATEIDFAEGATLVWKPKL